MESFIYGVGLTGGVVLFVLFWRLRHRASAQRTAQERDWAPLAAEYDGDLHLSHEGELAKNVLEGRANGAAFRVLTSHHTDLDAPVAGVLPRNNDYQTQVQVACRGAGPTFVLRAVPVGEGDVPFGSDAFAERYALSHAAGAPAAVVDSVVQARLIEAHRRFLEEGVAFLTGGKTVVARFSTRTTETNVVRAAIEIATRVAAASGAVGKRPTREAEAAGTGARPEIRPR